MECLHTQEQMLIRLHKLLVGMVNLFCAYWLCFFFIVLLLSKEKGSENASTTTFVGKLKAYVRVYSTLTTSRYT